MAQMVKNLPTMWETYVWSLDQEDPLINNKSLLYSTGNYIQYLAITYNAKESKKECVYIYIYIYNQITLLYTWA